MHSIGQGGFPWSGFCRRRFNGSRGEEGLCPRAEPFFSQEAHPGLQIFLMLPQSSPCTWLRNPGFESHLHPRFLDFHNQGQCGRAGNCPSMGIQVIVEGGLPITVEMPEDPGAVVFLDLPVPDLLFLVPAGSGGLPDSF